jgi:rare lipoprotein A
MVHRTAASARRFAIAAVSVTLVLVAAVRSPGEVRTDDVPHTLEGYASWYAGKFHGRTTASGEIFDTNEFTAAHKTLPFGTVVEVTHTDNGRSVQVRINDRGPFVEGRVIDLSRAAAEALNMTAEGVARVHLQIIAEPEPTMKLIQVASFASAANARRKRDYLHANGVPAEIERAGPLRRVVVSGLRNHQVDALLARLAALGYRDVLVRSE